MAPVYRSKYSQIPGTSYEEVMPAARKEFNKVRSRTKRKPYVRSMYFKRDKVFLSVFWEHLAQKRRGVKARRLKLYMCALDLLRNNTHTPETTVVDKDKRAILFRFAGKSRDGKKFYVQVKQAERSRRKDFMSVFPANE